MANVLYCSIGHFQRATKGIGDVLTQVNTLTNRSVARIFQRGVTAGTPSGDRRLYMAYTAALPRVSAG